MSYLQRPRFHFFGKFETDVSTVNNLTQNFDEGKFTPGVDDQTRDGSLGSWNPLGSGTFKLLDCGVKAAHYLDGTDAQDDAVLGMQIVDAGDRVPGKLVDLDPDQQMVSQIWGLRLRLMTREGVVAFGGRFAVTPFTDIWPRQQQGGGSGAMSAFYQSELLDVEWGAITGSRFLDELRTVAGDGPLSVRFVVDSFHGNYTHVETFRLGRLAGSLGVARPGEPRHFTRGRQLFSAQMSSPGFPFAPPGPALFNAVAIADRAAGSIVVDVGNALPTGPAPSFAIADIGTLELGTGTAAAFEPLGEIPYGTDLYERTAGVVEIPVTAAVLERIERTPLAIRGTVVGQPTIIALEAVDGSHVRADDFVFRLSPGDEVRIPLYATAFGRPLAGAEVLCEFDNSAFTGGPASDPPNPPGTRDTPFDGTPADALQPAGAGGFPCVLRTNADGIAWLNLVASNPRNPRGYVDGQVYGIRPVLVQTSGIADERQVNPSDFISVLLFDEVLIPDQPTWWTHVHPILQQYANLYPIMKQVLDLGDYQSVVAHKKMLELVFSLPVGDPNYMPVTRDLSPKKRELLLKWLSVTGGEPLLGTPPPLGSVPAPTPVPVVSFAAEGVAAAADELSVADALGEDADEQPIADGKGEFLRRTPRYGKELEKS